LKPKTRQTLIFHLAALGCAEYSHWISRHFWAPLFAILRQVSSIKVKSVVELTTERATAHIELTTDQEAVLPIKGIIFTAVNGHSLAVVDRRRLTASAKVIGSRRSNSELGGFIYVSAATELMSFPYSTPDGFGKNREERVAAETLRSYFSMTKSPRMQPHFSRVHIVHLNVGAFYPIKTSTRMISARPPRATGKRGLRIKA